MKGKLMIKRLMRSKALWRTIVPGGSLFVLGGCNALSDAQLSAILQSTVTTSLNALVTSGLTAFLSAFTGTA